MANGLFTPLQLTASYGIGTNTAFTIPASLNSAYSAYTIHVVNLINMAIYVVTRATWASGTVKHNIQNIVGTGGECPALGSAQSTLYSLNDYYTVRELPGFGEVMRMESLADVVVTLWLVLSRA